MGGATSSINTDSTSSEVSRSRSYFTWNIEGLESNLDGALVSPVFTAGRLQDHQFVIRAYPTGRSVEAKDHLSVYLELVSCPEDKQGVAWAKFGFHLLDIDRHVAFPFGTKKPYKFAEGKDWGFNRFLRRDILLSENYGLVRNGRVSLVCVIEIVQDPMKPIQNIPTIVDENQNELVLSKVELPSRNATELIEQNDRGALIVLGVHISMMIYQRLVTYEPC